MSPHPLDPLSSAEIAAAVAVVREQGGLHASFWFETVTLEEPTRDELTAFAKGTQLPRRAFVGVYEPAGNRTLDGVVNLDAGRLERFEVRPGAQARIVGDEFLSAGAIARSDPRFIAALAKRGITDVSRVSIEPWSGGNFGIEGEEGMRIAYGHCFLANPAGDNPYGMPIGNLHPVFDLRARKLLRVDDFGVVPLPPDSAAIRLDKGFRTDVKEISITQPKGVSFEVEGQLVKWQKWRFRVGFNYREGLVLHEIGYEDKGRVRPIMHRAAMNEMVVPYGDPSGGHYRRNAFDVGEYGLGQYLDSLKLGCDCLGVIRYFNADVHDWHGRTRTIENAICMHEEDFGTLWKYTDWIKGTVTVTRSRRLVVSAFATIGNYVYGTFWYFYQDGTIGVEVKATGVPLPTGVAPGTKPKYGALVADGIAAHVHQHVFSFRFDMCVDGENNAVREVNFHPEPWSDENPQGNAMRIETVALQRELDAQRVIDPVTSRYWKVINPSATNAVGEPVGYKLVPGANSFPIFAPGAPVLKRAGFMSKHFWATAYDPRELYAAGWYPNQSAGGDGLPRYTEKNRVIENRPLSVWYTLNYHHMPRPEDWPVQPVVYAGFHWMPVGFFDQNPALDVPHRTAGEGDSCCA
jgi:primary-amine oxidase